MLSGSCVRSIGGSFGVNREASNFRKNCSSVTELVILGEKKVRRESSASESLV